MSKKRSIQKRNPAAGELQKRVNLQALARHFLGEGAPGGDAMVHVIVDFNPDHAEYHVFKDYFRNPVTGDRGSAIMFVMRLRKCSYDAAIGYLEGWLDGQAST